jgi:hypothetical protein
MRATTVLSMSIHDAEVVQSFFQLLEKTGNLDNFHWIYDDLNNQISEYYFDNADAPHDPETDEDMIEIELD